MAQDKTEIPAATEPGPARGYIRKRFAFWAKRSETINPAPPFKSMSTTTPYPYVQPAVQQVKWQGPDLAIAQIQQYLDNIKRELQPVRADIISTSAEDAVKVLALLKQWVDALPPPIKA